MKSRRPRAHNKDAFCCCCVSADLELNFENETNLEKCLGFYVVIGILAAELITQPVCKHAELELEIKPM